MDDDTPEASWDDETRYAPAPEPLPSLRDRFPTLQSILDAARPIAEVYGLREEVDFPWRM